MRRTIADYFRLLLDFPEKKIQNVGYLPRWIIFAIDVFILLLSCIATYIIITSINGVFDTTLNTPIRYLVVISINSFFFLAFRTYAGIIRHSTFLDGVKLLFSCSVSFLLLLLLNLFSTFVLGEKIFLNTGLFINHTLAFLMLFLFRIMIKYIFERYRHNENRKKLIKAVIYGADANAISVANALKTELPARFQLLGFIDKFHQSKSSKSILNLPIVSQSKNIYVLLRAMKADAVIMAEKSLSKEEIVQIVEECLEYGFKVYTVPLIADWEDQKAISKKVKTFEIEDLLERRPIVLDMKSISSQLKDKTIMITGAAGSIGSEITRQVLAFGPKTVIMLDQAESPLHALMLEVSAKEYTTQIFTVLTDIRNSDILERTFATYKPDVVYHAAAYKHVPLMEENPEQAVFTNVMGTKCLADFSIRHGVERFVMVSTDKAVNPSSVMGASKRIAEKYVQCLQLKHASNPTSTKFITTRFGNVLGSNGSIVPLFSKQIAEGGPLTITHPDIIRYFMTIPEACQLVLEAGAMGKGGEIYIFDMGKPVKIIDLAKKMIRLAGFTPGKDMEIKIIGLRPGEKLYEELLNDESRTLPTHNIKIMIAEEKCEQYDIVSTQVDELLEDAKKYSHQQIVAKMKTIVPEFKSMNSVFETLDMNKE